mgnify:FL=1
MENASKALIMAATVLLGVMIISVGVTLYRTFSSFSAETAKQVQDKQTAEWNNNYLKYYGSQTYFDSNKKQNVTEPIKVTAHDIITVINNARQNNIRYFGEDISKWPTTDLQNFYYVKVDIQGENYAEKWNENKKIEFVKNNSLSGDQNQGYKTKYYKCTKAEISDITKRVYYIVFKES